MIRLPFNFLLMINKTFRTLCIAAFAIGAPVFAFSQHQAKDTSVNLINLPKAAAGGITVGPNAADPGPNPDGVPIADYWHIILFAAGLLLCFAVLKKIQKSKA